MFTNDSASHAALVGASGGAQAGLTISGSTAAGVVTVSYDSSSQSYTITGQAGAQTFAPADLQTSPAGQTTYLRQSASSLDRLTLVQRFPSAPAATQYVSLGILQHNTSDASNNIVLNTDIFTFGSNTPATGVPRTGEATFDTSLYGVATMVGSAPLQLTGYGRFDVDLGLGRFTTSGSMAAATLAGNTAMPYAVNLSAGGSLSSTDGTFSGYATATGTSTLPATAGALTGRFYGPNGEELGAAFSLTNTASNVAIAGGMIGTLNTTTAPAVLSLVNLPSGDQALSALEVVNTISSTAPAIAATTPASGQFTVNSNGALQYAPAGMTPAAFTAADEVTGAAPNFTRYQRTGTNPATLDLYSSPAGNTELALTYTNFGYWTSTQGGATTQSWVLYGATTPSGYITGQTGTATYAGVAYGTASAGSPSSPTQTALSGRSSYTVDFGHQTYNLAFNLGSTGPTSTDYGSYTYNGGLVSGSQTFASSGVYSGNISTQFYGPTAEEVGSAFSVLLSSGAHAGAAVNGVAVAKKQ